MPCVWLRCLAAAVQGAMVEATWDNSALVNISQGGLHAWGPWESKSAVKLQTCQLVRVAAALAGVCPDITRLHQSRPVCNFA